MAIIAVPASAESKAARAPAPRRRPSRRRTRAIVSVTNSFPGVLLVIALEFLEQVGLLSTAQGLAVNPEPQRGPLLVERLRLQHPLADEADEVRDLCQG